MQDILDTLPRSVDGCTETLPNIVANTPQLAVQAFTLALRGKDNLRQLAMIQADLLIDIEPAAAKELAIAGMNDPNPIVRKYAAQILRNLTSLD